MRHNEIAMKRCPQCYFLYHDSDEVCDLDGTLLVITNENVAGVRNERQLRGPRKGWKIFSIVAVAGLVLSISLFLVYHRMTQQTQIASSNESLNVPVVLLPQPLAESSSQATPTPTSEPSVAPIAKPSPAVRATSGRRQLSSNPVSTGGDEGAKRGVIIRLIDGRALPADEAWRTNEGIWYRRNGIVTLLRLSQVKAIDKAP